MALLWIDGFESYGDIGSAPQPADVLGDKYLEYRRTPSTANTQIKEGRYNKCLWMSDDSIRRNTGSTDTTIIIGCAIKFDNIESGRFIRLINTLDLSDYIGINVVSNEFHLNMGATDWGTTSIGVVTGVWYYLELKVVVGVSGSYDFRINGDTKLSDSGIDTRTDPSVSYYDIFILGNTASPETNYDDLYVCDGSGSVNNDLLGGCRVDIIYPDGDGNYSQFTPLSGDNYTNVDDPIADADSSYVESTTSGHKDTYTYGPMSEVILEDIFGLQISTDCRETDAEGFDVKTIIRTNSTDYIDAGQPIGSTDYYSKIRIAELNPDTSAAWNNTEINNTEFGLEVG